MPPKKKPNNDQRRPTGIDALDQVLHGGFPTGATVLLAGSSGTGKTILATQWLFRGFEKFAEPGLYISLTEPVSKALKNLATLSYFSPEMVDPLKIYFTDLRTVMKGMDLNDQDFTKADIVQLVEVIRNMCKQSGAKRVVLDSVTAMAYRLNDKDLIRDFIFQLGTMLGQMDVNVIMTSEVAGDGYSVFGVEEFICDGILKLSYVTPAEERVRQLEVIKMRGTSFNPHPSMYRLTEDGMRLFPYMHRELQAAVSDERLPSGISGLDTMSNGGYFKGSATLLSGASGTGKTIIALHAVNAALKQGKKCLYVSLEESRDQLLRNSTAFGWDMVNYEKSGQLRVMTLYPEQRYLDEHFLEIKAVVEDGETDMVVVDSLTALGNTFPEHFVRDFTARLVTMCKAHLVTSFFTHASETMLGASGITEAHLSSLFDNIVMLRFVEVRSALRRGLLIVKMRGSLHDEALREFNFAADGINVTSDFSGYEGVMRGETKKTSETIEEKLRGLLIGIFGPRGEAILQREKANGLTFEGTHALLKELSDQGVLSVGSRKKFMEELEEASGR